MTFFYIILLLFIIYILTFDHFNQSELFQNEYVKLVSEADLPIIQIGNEADNIKPRATIPAPPVPIHPATETAKFISEKII